MIVKIEGPIETFAKWKAMVHSNSEKIKKYGITFLYAGSEKGDETKFIAIIRFCLLYTSPSPRDGLLSRMPSSA